MNSILNVILLCSLLPEARALPLELHGPVIYSYAGVPILPRNQRHVSLQSSPLLLWNLRPHRTAADHSELNLPRLRLTNRYSSPRRASNERMRGVIQTTLGVDPRQLRRAPYGDLGSAASGFEPTRRSRDISHSFSPRRRTMSNPNLNSIRSPRQLTRRRSDVLRTRAPENYRSPMLPIRSRAPVRPMSGGPVRDISAYLEQFGYLEKNRPGEQHSEHAKRNAISEFQQVAGLSVTGEVNTETIGQMKKPRCGLPDNIRGRDRLPPDAPHPPDNPQAFTTYPGYKWDKTVLTYKFTGYTGQLPVEQIRRAWKKAFRKWEAVSPLRFVEIHHDSRQYADIRIDFVRYAHQDGFPFDGKGRVLAHAFFPYDSDLAGDIHMDESEKWAFNTNDGIDMSIVLAHEVGHSIGLGHSNISEALMAPYYRGWQPNWGLHEDDVSGVQFLYGRTFDDDSVKNGQASVETSLSHCNKDNYIVSDEFEIRPDPTMDCGVSCP